MKKVLIASLLAPVMSVALYAAPALADFDNIIKVKNDNSASVSNDVSVVAKTGNNDANGDNGGSGGNGGDIYNGGGGDVEDSSTGNGGDGGAGGWGGAILTGDATAGADVTNKVNTNITKVENDCDCDDILVKVKNLNDAYVHNYVSVFAETGSNDANGDPGGSGGDGGDISNSGYDDVENSHTGDGGAGGVGGDGGGILTGDAVAGASVVNRVNKNVTRILHF